MNREFFINRWGITLRNTFLKVVRFTRDSTGLTRRAQERAENDDKKPLRDVLLVFLMLVGAAGLVIGVFVATNVVWALGMPIPEFGQLQNRYDGESTKLYDRTGTVLLYDTAGTMRRTTVPLEDISPYLLSATVAIEDDTFYTHPGIRPDAIVRALLKDIKSGSLDQGGSTITQQIIKNALLSKDKSFSRKLKEGVLALRIEREYTKDEILTTYLNETPYGGTMYGVEEASRAYFGKSAKDVTLSEAAYIAALPKAPTYFSPWGTHRNALTLRHAGVLRIMREHNLIPEEEYQAALAEDVVFVAQSSENIKAPHFVFYVLEELEKKYGREEVYNGRLQIVTTLDWKMQQESEAIIRKGATENEKKFNASNAGLVAIDPRTGQILAMVGSRNYFDDSVDGQVNVATALRQPGSSFKPFVYATAFKKGYTPDTVLFDLKTQFSTACAPSNFSNEYPCYSPENYDEKYRGPMTIRDALAQSVNIVGVKALYLSGIEDSIATARSLGITTLKDGARYGLTLVLGGGEVTLLEMTGAYGAFANDGVWYPPTPILSIRTADGDVVESFEGKAQQALSTDVARAINDILSDNTARTPAFGPDSPLHFEGTMVADKTGTTNDYRDAWVIGYTPNIVVGTWAGNNDNTPMNKAVSAYILAPMWHAAMEKAIARFPFPPFQSFVKNDDALPATSSVAIYFDPPTGVHEISYWMHKGASVVDGVPNLYDDPQIARWGYPVALWAVNQASSMIASEIGSSSTLAFGIGGPDGVPLRMSFTTPADGSRVRVNQPFIAEISHSEMASVLSVSYYLNDVFVGSSHVAPFSLSVTTEKRGTAILRAVAESPLGNSEAVTTITVGNSSRGIRQISGR
jgi:1A family penicillin-binding protein